MIDQQLLAVLFSLTLFKVNSLEVADGVGEADGFGAAEEADPRTTSPLTSLSPTAIVIVDFAFEVISIE